MHYALPKMLTKTVTLLISELNSDKFLDAYDSFRQDAYTLEEIRVKDKKAHERFLLFTGIPEIDLLNLDYTYTFCGLKIVHDNTLNPNHMILTAPEIEKEGWLDLRKSTEDIRPYE